MNKNMNVVFELVRRDLKKKYRGSMLGVIWSLLNPLLMMIILTIVFSNVFRFDTGNYPLYLITGQVLFGFFSEATSISMMSIISNFSLIKKIYVTKWLFPFSSVTFSFVNAIFSLVAVFFIVFFTGGKFYLSYLLIPVVYVYLFIFSLGIGLMLASVTVFFRDMMYLYNVFLTILMYVTPIFYPENIIPEAYKILVSLNPLIYFLKYFRKLILEGVVPGVGLNVTCLLISSVSLVVGILVFKFKENKFVLDI